jgi:uracil-DNA glycosylase family 4
MKKDVALATIHKKWLKQCTCELRHTAKRGVPGHGNPEADIVFIGEAPGKKEDETGIPFVGAAGKFLDEMLASIKMKREDVYITNVVKYRPPENRDPTQKEKEDCRKWLHEELNCISPKLIIFLGRHSMNDFFPELKISSAHGKLVHEKLPGINAEYFLPLYHPASALYNGSLRTTLLADFKKIPSILRKIEGR